MVYSDEKYKKMLNSIRNDSNVMEDVDTDLLTDVLNELGIQKSTEKEYKLILWNDHVNDMVSIVVALYEICKLSNEECVKVMLEAHKNGKAVAKKGSFEELKGMKEQLNKRNIEVTIEKN